jgi:hypothetical protein
LLGDVFEHEVFFSPGAVHILDRHSHEDRQPDPARHESRS